MTSTIFTRRAMLSGSALLGLGTLLAACGQQANSEAAAASASSTTAIPKPRMASIAKLMVTALRRMFLFRKPSRNSTPRLNKASTA